MVGVEKNGVGREKNGVGREKMGVEEVGMGGGSFLAGVFGWMRRESRDGKW